MIVEKIAGQTLAPIKAEHSISHQNWVEAAQVSAAFSISHDGSSIYLIYHVTEDQVRAVNTEYNSAVWDDSCVEFFLSLETDGENYYNFEFNAIGTVLGAYGKNRNQREWLSESLLSQVQTAPSLGRQVIESLEETTSWTLQVRIPVQVLNFSGVKDLSGMDGHANFYKCGDKLKQPHFLSWKPVILPSPDFHQPRFFGQLSFL
ncbi:MAG: carbohydrate-binding family 9-like protein [Bacteroidota bacterium]